MKRVITMELCVALLFSGTSTLAADRERVAKELLSIYTDLNEMCRGWSGDDPHTDEVCNVRTKVSNLLWKHGYCFGKKGQYGGEAWWHKCTRDSYHFGEKWK
jgi:hypothetical protein